MVTLLELPSGLREVLEKGTRSPGMRVPAPAALFGRSEWAKARWACRYQKLVGSEILEDSVLPKHGRWAMLNILRSLIGAARSFFRTQRSLALENLALRHQVGVLKRSVGNRRLRIGPADRGLWATLSRVFDGWEKALAIVELATVIGWHRAGFRRLWTRKSRTGKPGRPLLDHAIRDLIRGMSRANPTWGSPRVRNERAKLGIELSRATVAARGSMVGASATGSTTSTSRRC